MKIPLKVIPHAKKKEIRYEGSSLKIKLTSPPQRGRANEELIEFLASIFNIKKSDIKIVKGEKERNKLLSIPITEEVFQTIIQKIQELQ